VNIREMTIEDHNSVIRLWQNTEGIGLSSADAVDKQQGFMERNPHLSFIAQDEGRVVGTVMCGHDGRRGFIYHLAVDPACRRQGIGRQLVEYCLAGLKTAGIEKCHIMVFANNQEGLAFWEKMGWKLRDDISLLSRSV